MQRTSDLKEAKMQDALKQLAEAEAREAEIAEQAAVESSKMQAVVTENAAIIVNLRKEVKCAKDNAARHQANVIATAERHADQLAAVHQELDICNLPIKGLEEDMRMLKINTGNLTKRLEEEKRTLEATMAMEVYQKNHALMMVATEKAQVVHLLAKEQSYIAELQRLRTLGFKTRAQGQRLQHQVVNSNADSSRTQTETAEEIARLRRNGGELVLARSALKDRDAKIKAMQEQLDVLNGRIAAETPRAEKAIKDLQSANASNQPSRGLGRMYGKTAPEIIDLTVTGKRKRCKDPPVPSATVAPDP